MRKQFLEIGKIVATQGLGGEVRVQYYCDSADVICSFDRLFLGKRVAISILIIGSPFILRQTSRQAVL